MGRPRKESAGTSSPRPATTASKTAPAAPPPSTSATRAKAAAAGSQSRGTSAAKATTPSQGRGTKAEPAQPRSTASRGARGDAGDKSRAPTKSSTTQKAPDAKGAAGPARTDVCSQKKQPGADLSKSCDRFLPPVKSQDIPKVEKETRGQRENPKWYELRENRITASVAPKIANSKFANSKTDEVPKSYLKEVVGSGSKVQTPAMSWGIRNEKVAVEAYKQKSQKGGKPVQVEDCGLFIHPEKQWLAASPDGIIKDPATGKDLGLLEVKCPYKHRNRTVREACKDKDFCLEVNGDSYALKKNHPYFTQVQCQLGTTGFQRADFVVHTKKETAVVPVEFDGEFWGKTVPKLEKFYTEAVIPHLEQKAGSSVYANEE
ncbi:PREDICTED: uncharacterized protein LOC101821607 [Ficedula albicollis]|uniref:YqaJ viral recombinase domain-containing protein n=1 Tax=Ficedula albicollis TaxID=59894 RepID=A0A803VNB2_FICAL|nr:PREDICTED: uncharacterized protein LOC101821607 [Ficedula albicollis]XP_005051264.1 PREDICTED: uncharacterized protein LOC101821607 [Ficedula albicollis]XP_005051265.1 PREDICTED: uncharacterized protein LOC101821607 [Ficedula albicollis]